MALLPIFSVSIHQVRKAVNFISIGVDFDILHALYVLLTDVSVSLSLKLTPHLLS